MAYEVTKLVKGRPYRYRVHSERDPATGKFRNRWTYLGRGDATTASAPRPQRANAREALLDALERLLEHQDIDAVTAAAVSAEAGLAHGTFYRYFRNKNDVLRAVMERLRRKRAGDERLQPKVPATQAEARAWLRGWASFMLRAPAENRGLARAWHDLVARDPEFGAERRASRAAYVARIGEYLGVLVDRGFAQLADPLASARVLFALLDGIQRETLQDAGPLDEARAAAALDLIERGVFGAAL